MCIGSGCTLANVPINNSVVTRDGTRAATQKMVSLEPRPKNCFASAIVTTAVHLTLRNSPCIGGARRRREEANVHASALEGPGEVPRMKIKRGQARGGGEPQEPGLRR